jgi:hypothetical protein
MARDIPGLFNRGGVYCADDDGLKGKRRIKMEKERQAEFDKFKMEGIEWLYSGKGNVLDGCLATSSHADIKLIGAWMAYWWGRDKAERYTVSPSRGHSYKIGSPQVLYVTVSNPKDHREGVKPIYKD